LTADNTVRDDKTYHVLRESVAYHYIRSQVKDGNGEHMWLKIKEITPDKEVIFLGYVSTPIVQMAVDNEREYDRLHQGTKGQDV